MVGMANKPILPNSPDLQSEVLEIIVRRRPDLAGKTLEEVQALLAQEIAAKGIESKPSDE
jgi:hypothetical protein